MNAYEHHTNQYMINNDCSLSEMYRRMGVTKANHRMYIRNRIPQVDKGYKIAKFLNIPIEILWGLDNDE